MMQSLPVREVTLNTNWIQSPLILTGAFEFSGTTSIQSIMSIIPTNHSWATNVSTLKIKHMVTKESLSSVNGISTTEDLDTMRHRLMLAPMVRISTVPMRLLALKYGADVVYSPELVDKRLCKSVRKVNEELGTIDFVEESSQKLNLRIHPSEKQRLIVQLGSSDPISALQAARLVEADVAGINLNCGCPKKFSVVSGMGAALLENQSTLLLILDTLVKNLSVPVSCKIRLLDERPTESFMDRTISLLQRIESTGVSEIAIHARFRDERPRQPAHWDVFERLADSVSIPIIANGDIWNRNDADRLAKLTKGKISGFMIARGAQANVSVFRKEGLLPPLQVMLELIQLGKETRMNPINIKYMLLRMIEDTDYLDLLNAINGTRCLDRMEELIREYVPIS